MFAPHLVRCAHVPRYSFCIKSGLTLVSPIHRVYSRRNHITARNERNDGPTLSTLPLEYTPSAQKKRRHRKGRAPTISTFDPQRLLPSDVLDLSGRTSLTVKTVCSSPSLSQPASLQFASCKRRGHFVHDRFPPNTRGFLYYHSPRGLPPTAGEIRFRVTSTGDPSSFSSGVDLLLQSGAPWTIPALVVSGNSKYTTFRTRLLNDGLVSSVDMLQCQQIFEAGALDRMSIIMHSLDQTFPVRFDATRFTIWTVGHGTVGSCLFLHAFSDWRAEYHGFPMYNGSGLARFEIVSTPKRTNKFHIVMRIVKIVEPVVLRIPGYDGYVRPPTEGSLVTRGEGEIGRGIWSIGLDTISDCHKNIRLLLPKPPDLTSWAQI